MAPGVLKWSLPSITCYKLTLSMLVFQMRLIIIWRICEDTSFVITFKAANSKLQMEQVQCSWSHVTLFCSRKLSGKGRIIGETAGQANIFPVSARLFNLAKQDKQIKIPRRCCNKYRGGKTLEIWLKFCEAHFLSEETIRNTSSWS